MRLSRKEQRRIGMEDIHRRVDAVVRAGWNPLEANLSAIQQECGVPRMKGDSILDYLARAAQVSRNTVDRYIAAINAGEDPTPDMERIHKLMNAVGRRVCDMLARTPQRSPSQV
jgi:hypothetical protein